MKDNKSRGVDGIPPKLLKEIVEQSSIPLAKVIKFVTRKWNSYAVIYEGIEAQVGKLQIIRNINY